MGIEIDPQSEDDLAEESREAFQAAIDSTAEQLLGASFERVKPHLRDQLSERGIGLSDEEVDDLARLLAAGEHVVIGAGFVEELRGDGSDSTGHEQQFYPGHRPRWWQRLRRGPTSSGVQVFDKAEYHYLQEWPEDLDPQQAFVHTGMYVGWLLQRGLIRDSVFQGSRGQELLRRFRDREATGAEVYQQWFGGELASPMLTKEGNGFTRAYFDFDAGTFLEDYAEVLGEDFPELYYVQDSWTNFDRLSAVLDKRYDEWRAMPRRRRCSRRRWGPTPS